MSNVGLIIDSTSGARAIYAPITTSANNTGGLKLDGTNNITLFGNVGTNNASLSFISFRQDNKLIIDSSSGVRDIYSVIQNDGPTGQGTLSTSGGNDITFRAYVGAVSPLGTIDLTANTGGTITFNRYARATNIRVGARPVVFADTADNVTGNIQLTHPASDVTFSAAMNPYEHNITNTTGTANKGIVNITTNNMTLANGSTIGAAPASGATSNVNALQSVKFLTDHSLILQGANIWAETITPATPNQGTLTVNTNNSAIYGTIGVLAAGATQQKDLKLINIANAHSLTVNGSIYAKAITMSNDGAALVLTGGTAGNGLENHITATIQGTAAGQGKINVGIPEGAMGNVHFDGIIGATNAPGLLTLAGGAGNNPGSSAALFAAATFDGTIYAGTSGIRIGHNATLVVGEPYIPAGQGAPVNPVTHTLTLNNGATIDGTGGALPNVAGNGQGVLVMVNTNLPKTSGNAAVPVGANGRLQSIQMHGFNRGSGAAPLNVQTYTDMLDLTYGSRVVLDGNAITKNGDIYTGVTSSDSSSIPGANNSYADFSMNTGNTLTVGNLGVITNINGTGTLIAQSSLPAPSLLQSNALNQPMINFIANGRFHLQDGGAVSAITATNGVGTVQTLGNANFVGNIGAAGASLNTLTLVGPGQRPQDTHINFINATAGAAQDIYAQTIRQENFVLHSNQNNLNIRPTTYIMKNATLDVENKTISIIGGTVVLEGNIVINTSYTGDATHAALDMSGVTAVTATNLTSITFGIHPDGGHTPTFGNTMMMIKVPTNGASVHTGITPTIFSNFQNGQWVPSGSPGQLVFTQFPSGFTPQPQLQNGQSNSIAGANPENAKIMTSNVQNVQQQAIANTLNMAGVRMAFMVPSFAMQQNVPTPPAMGGNFSSPAAMPNVGGPAPGGPAAMPNVGGPAPGGPGSAGKSGPAGGPAVGPAVENPQNVKAAAENPQNGAGTGGKTQPKADETTATTKTKAGGADKDNADTPLDQAEEEVMGEPGDDLQAVAAGIAAGDSPYDKYGVWGSINGGLAKQKENKGNLMWQQFAGQLFKRLFVVIQAIHIRQVINNHSPNVF